METLSMEISTLAQISGWVVGIIGVLVAIMAFGIGWISISYQRTMSKKIKMEIVETASKKLDKALKDPKVSADFMNLIFDSEDFKSKFSKFINIEVENILELGESNQNYKEFAENNNSNDKIKKILQEKE
ncbi:hypothetical protein [Helicobacter sp. 11S03491-1]|uniref:hypothetical protein n=1 Tax=Helicobacter sp. 11S03491-1 TaxID=1476196 RepID=UPI000BA632C0|nr:hypothetical protein [Helicobacter sp. 11S03491-1]PAF41802.1 hypothetical protein BKH45_05680 [Helicobacter sp. 11S03491-1]